MSKTGSILLFQPRRRDGDL